MKALSHLVSEGYFFVCVYIRVTLCCTDMAGIAVGVRFVVSKAVALWNA